MYSATDEKPFAPHFRSMKGRNNDFLFGMHFSAFLWWNVDSWGAERWDRACASLKVSSVFGILSNTQTPKTSHYVRLSG